MEKYISYLDIAKQLELPEGAIVYLSSELIQIALLAKRNNERFDADKLIDSFLEVLGEKGTLCIPVFNFDFTNCGFYDYRKSKGTTGVLGHLPMIFDAKWQNFCVRKIPMPMPVQAQGS